jgi:hypothetical protein
VKLRSAIVWGGAGLAGLFVAGAVFRRRAANPIEATQGFPGKPKSYYAEIAKEVGWDTKTAKSPTPKARAVWEVQKATLNARNAKAAEYALAHPELTGVGADGVRGKFGPAPDKFSKQSFLLYRPRNKLLQEKEEWGWYFTDEFGRPFEGWGTGGSALGGLLPIVQTALPLIPGIGTAGGAALGAAIAIGQGKSTKDIGLAAARGALPPYATMAFDAGVAIASGHSLSEAAQSAALTALEERYPGSRAAFAEGKSVYARG